MSQAQAQARAVYDRLARLAVVASGDIETARANYSMITDGFTLPEDVSCEPVSANGVSGEWVRTSASRPDTVLVYLHGGGYVVGSAAPYRPLVSELARNIRATGLSVNYALAPEHPFPAGIEDVVRVYRYLLDQDISPSQIVLAGDSAGGGLTIALMLSLRDAGIRQPAGAWLISPLADLEHEGESVRSRRHLDPISTPEIAKASVAAYLQGASPRDPRASPIHADFEGLPAIRIDVGSHETLLDDAIRLARRAAIADVHVDLSIWPGLTHIFPVFAPMLEDGKRAVAAASAFLSNRLADAGPNWQEPPMDGKASDPGQAQ